VKLGIFGGTFDPPHAGHLMVAQDAIDVLALDLVLFVPAAVPPHKRHLPITPAAIRLAMLEAATAGNDRFAIDDLELRREGPSYTVDTLRAIGTRRPDAHLVLLLGADQYADLDTWREPGEIRRLAQIGVLARGDADTPPPAEGVVAVPVTRIDLSSTDVRERVAAGRSIRYLVPDEVAELILRHGLYGSPGSGPGMLRTGVGMVG
jgi:nicotinate-nucleotide adenylyltransferase